MKLRLRRQRLALAVACLAILPVLLLVLFSSAFASARVGASPSSAGYALRFYGNGTSDIDRIKIPVDNPETVADIGATDFTIEWWMRLPADSSNQPGSCAQWICGNIIFDRDIYDNHPRDYGISLYNGRVRFGSGANSATVQSTIRITDTAWHHIAVTRNVTSGQQCIFVDGALDRCRNTPAGDISYPNGYIDPQFPNNPYLVIGAEKHDINPSQYPSFDGELDEVRVSNLIRYASTFTRPVAPFTPDPNTVLLYHFDEGSGSIATDSATFPGGPVHGDIRIGGNPTGPVYVTSTIPFTGSPTLTPTPSLTNTPTTTATASSTPSSTPSNTATNTPTPSDTPTSTATATATPSNTPTNTATYTPTPSNTPTNTATYTSTPSSTATSTATYTPTPSNTSTNTPTPSNTPSNTSTNTPTPSNTPSNTSTNTPTPSTTPTNTATYTSTPSNTPSNTATFTPTPSNTSTNTATYTPTPSSTPANTATYTPTPSNTATFTPTPSNTPAHTATYTPTPSNTATSTATYTPTPSDTPTFTPTSTSSSTATQTSTPTQTPTPTPGSEVADHFVYLPVVLHEADSSIQLAWLKRLLDLFAAYAVQR